MKQNQIRRTCAFTGHRPSKLPWRYNENDPQCIKMKQILFQQIEKMVNGGYTDFYTGAAEGIDTWSALMILGLRQTHSNLKLHCILPYKGQTAKWSVWSQIQYRYILEEADSIEWMYQQYVEGCELKRNQYMIDQVVALLAVCDGQLRSGASATINYARKKKCYIWNLNPRTFELKAPTTIFRW